MQCNKIFSVIAWWYHDFHYLKFIINAPVGIIMAKVHTSYICAKLLKSKGSKWNPILGAHSDIILFFNQEDLMQESDNKKEDEGDSAGSQHWEVI